MKITFQFDWMTLVFFRNILKSFAAIFPLKIAKEALGDFRRMERRHWAAKAAANSKDTYGDLEFRFPGAVFHFPLMAFKALRWKVHLGKWQYDALKWHHSISDASLRECFVVSLADLISERRQLMV